MSVASRVAIAIPCGGWCVKSPQCSRTNISLAMHVLIASSSAFRRDLYQQAVHSLGHEVVLADGGVDCVQQMRSHRPDLLVLEAPLLWGGSDGVLEIMGEQQPP